MLFSNNNFLKHSFKLDNFLTPPKIEKQCVMNGCICLLLIKLLSLSRFKREFILYFSIFNLEPVEVKCL